MNRIFILLTTFFTVIILGQTKHEKKLSDFLPKGYVISEKVNGDLNIDGIDDIILIIKGTDKSKIIKDEFRGELDRNRRGIIVLFNKIDYYELASKNYNCFSSKNEDGGVYFPPELSVEIKKGNLCVHYAHGRYGFWKYTFRFKNSDFDLIGYNESNGGVVIESETSINFLTKKKLEKVNANKNSEGGDEVFKQVWKNISINKLIKLSKIVDFDEFEIPDK